MNGIIINAGPTELPEEIVKWSEEEKINLTVVTAVYKMLKTTGIVDLLVFNSMKSLASEKFFDEFKIK